MSPCDRHLFLKDIEITPYTSPFYNSFPFSSTFRRLLLFVMDTVTAEAGYTEKTGYVIEFCEQYDISLHVEAVIQAVLT